AWDFSVWRLSVAFHSSMRGRQWETIEVRFFRNVATIQGDYSKRRSHTLNTTVMLTRDLSHARTIPTHDVAPLCVPATPKIPAVARLR
ncbi:hypothetical protein M3674_18165, partial [Caldibacillus thermoamylovorans]|nr:hypothetical protein [Caldibacillus thermoamylovorans]